jgi:23S rRNA pseudouridine955/2504/2580 synthase
MTFKTKELYQKTLDADTNETSRNVQWLEISESNHEQRLDNFLINYLKGVPKTRIYRMVRKGEVRVNKGRAAAGYKLATGDLIRIPPVRVAEKSDSIIIQPALKYNLEKHILFEDAGLIVLNKPSGYPVHGGSGADAGIIEALRVIRSNEKFLELVHRLDKETSGCLLIAKKRPMLKELHELFRLGTVKKTYLALLAGQLKYTQKLVEAPLLKNVAESGERMVKISQSGKAAETLFIRLKQYQQTTLVNAIPKTGRTHQIRVHAAFLGHPIVGDSRYGEAEMNKTFKSRGYQRLFLHAAKLEFTHPLSGVKQCFIAPAPEELELLLANEKPL